MRRRRTWILAAAIPAIVVVAVMSRGPREVTLDDAEQEARHVLRAVGLPAEQPLKRAALVGPNWEIHTEDFRVSVDAASGKPTGFANMKPRPWVPKNQRKQRFATQADAEKELRNVAARIGVPADWKLEGVERGEEEVQGHFAEHPFGYAYFTQAGNFAHIMLDADDGALRGGGMRSDVIAERPDVRISREKAIVAATNLAKTLPPDPRLASYKGRLPNKAPITPVPGMPPPDFTTIRLGYIVPQVILLGNQPRPKARLAWLVRVSDRVLYVDAATGVATTNEPLVR